MLVGGGRGECAQVAKGVLQLEVFVVLVVLVFLYCIA